MKLTFLKASCSGLLCAQSYKRPTVGNFPVSSTLPRLVKYNRRMFIRLVTGGQIAVLVNEHKITQVEMLYLEDKIFKLF